MPETGHMLSRLPVPVFRDGSVGGVSAHFAADGKSLWLQTSAELMDASRWIGLYGADLAAPLLAVVVVWVLWKGHRARSRPQEPGRAHCPKCSYKMLPPLVKRDERERFVAPAGTICPECGLDLGKRRPVEGEAFLSRMWWVMGIGGVVVAACIGTLAITLAWGAGAGVGTGPNWPRRDMDKWVPGWRVVRRAPDWPPRQATRVERWNAETGELERVAAADLRPRGVGKLSDDRTRLGVGEGDDSGRAWVAVVDLERGEVKRKEIKGERSKAPWVSAEVLGFGAGGSVVYVTVMENRPSGIGGRTSLWKLDSVTLEGEKLDEREVEVRTGLLWPHEVYRVHDDGKGAARWVHASAYSSQSARSAVETEVTWSDGSGDNRSVTVDAPIGSMWGWFELSEDGLAFELRMQAPAGVSMRVNLASGEVGIISTVAVPTYASFEGRYEAKVQASGMVEVMERGASMALWSFQGTAGSYPLAVSDDGRRVAVMNMTGGTVGVEVWERGR